MRILSLIALAIVAFVASPLWAGSESETDRAAAEGAYEYGSIFLEPGWVVTVRPDGSVTCQYGSTPGDAVSLPKGTIDFRAFVQLVESSSLDKGVSGCQVALKKVGTTTTTAHYLKDDSFIRDLFMKNRDAWIFGPPSGRMPRLLEEIPYYKKTSQLEIELEQATVAGAGWLALIDQGEYGKSWDEASPLFQSKGSREYWITTISEVRKAYGKVESRKMTEADFIAPPTTEVHLFIKVAYDTKLADREIREVVTMVKDSDGKWRASGY